MGVVSILWRGEPLRSAEHCALEDTPGGHRLAGTVLLPLDGRPGVVRYRVEVDTRWCSRAAEVVRCDPDGEHRLVLGSDGQGRWTVDGSAEPALDGCLDVDLGFSPSTNTLPIRRLGEHGDAQGDQIVDVRAAWVRFPGFTVQPIEQSYQHRGAGHWTYRSGTFSADLDVAPCGLVLTYSCPESEIGLSLPAVPRRRLAALSSSPILSSIGSSSALRRIHLVPRIQRRTSDSGHSNVWTTLAGPAVASP